MPAQSARGKQLGGECAAEIASLSGSSPRQGRNVGRSKDSDRVRIVIESLRSPKSMKSHGGIQGRHGRIGSLNLRCALRNASDSHHFGSIVRHLGQNRTILEFESRSMTVFRRGMQIGVPAVHSCRLAAGSKEICAILD